MMLRNSVIAAVVAVAFGAVNAHADDTVSVAIDLSLLGSAEGTEVVYGQLEEAARSACRDSGVAGRVRAEVTRCSSDLMDQFVEDIGDTRLAVYHGEVITLAARD